MSEALVVMVRILLLPLDAGIGGHSVLHVRHGDGRRPGLLGCRDLLLDEQEVNQDLGFEVADWGKAVGGGLRGSGTVVAVVVMVVEESLYAIERGDLGGQKCLHVGVRPVTEMEE